MKVDIALSTHSPLSAESVYINQQKCQITAKMSDFAQGSVNIILPSRLLPKYVLCRLHIPKQYLDALLVTQIFSMVKVCRETSSKLLIHVFYKHNIYKHTEAQISKKLSIF